MQTINHWPDPTELALLPEIVAQDVYEKLTEPFDNESMAKAFWEESATKIIILEANDCIEQPEIQFALRYPEFITELKMGYQLILAITNDFGSGIYLVIPPELSSESLPILYE